MMIHVSTERLGVAECISVPLVFGRRVLGIKKLALEVDVYVKMVLEINMREKCTKCSSGGKIIHKHLQKRGPWHAWV